MDIIIVQDFETEQIRVQTISIFSTLVIFGQAGRIPGHVQFPPDGTEQQVTAENTEIFQELMTHHKKRKRPLKTVKSYVDRRLFETEFVYVKNEKRGGKNKNVWLGPYRILKREEKYFTLLMRNKEKNVTIDRLKTARMMTEESPSQTGTSESEETSGTSTDQEKAPTYNLRPNRRRNFRQLVGVIGRSESETEGESEQLFSSESTSTTETESTESEFWWGGEKDGYFNLQNNRMW